MSFSRSRAIEALTATNNHIERAVDWLFSHNETSAPSQNDQQTEKSETKKSEIPFDAIDTAIYQCKAVTVHIGNSTNTGHYIAYVLKDNQWVYYNDKKVALQQDPAIDKGYIYFFERIFK